VIRRDAATGVTRFVAVVGVAVGAVAYSSRGELAVVVDQSLIVYSPEL
jgi:hypothetical protein